MAALSKSRKHSSATHAIQQLHDLADQVPQSSQVESPSGKLKQGEPSLRQEEIEKGGNFAAEENLGDGTEVPLLEIMEEVGEKEVPLVDKRISVVGSQSLGIGLTEFVNMVVDEDDEVDSQRCVMDTIERYQVKPESMTTLTKNFNRHGDIAKNSTASTMLLSWSLETICGIISQMQGKHLMQIKEDFLCLNIDLVDRIKNMEVDIEWLHILLVEMLEAKQELGEKFGILKDLREKKESNKKNMKDAEIRLAECQERKRELSDLLKSTCDEEIVCKEAVAKENEESTKIAQTIKCATSKVKPFLVCAPVDLLF